MCTSTSPVLVVSNFFFVPLSNCQRSVRHWTIDCKLNFALLISLARLDSVAGSTFRSIYILRSRYIASVSAYACMYALCCTSTLMYKTFVNKKQSSTRFSHCSLASSIPFLPFFVERASLGCSRLPTCIKPCSCVVCFITVKTRRLSRGKKGGQIDRQHDSPIISSVY